MMLPNSTSYKKRTTQFYSLFDPKYQPYKEYIDNLINYHTWGVLDSPVVLEGENENIRLYQVGGRSDRRDNWGFHREYNRDDMGPFDICDY